MYRGYATVSDERLAAYYEGRDLHELLTNQYLITSDNQILRFDGDRLVGLRLSKLHDFKPRNDEQKMAFDLMDNDGIPIKCLVGIAGSGKTKIGLTFGLKALREGKVRKVLIVRQPSPVGEELGFFPGDKTRKMLPWFKPILDNADEGEFGIQRMFQYDEIEFECPAYMQGRDLQETFVLVDEAQMLTVEQIKMLGSRIGRGSVIVFAGDYEQIFNRRYVGERNGLIKMINTFAGKREFGIVYLPQSVRGRVAELFATLM